MNAGQHAKPTAFFRSALHGCGSVVGAPAQYSPTSEAGSSARRPTVQTKDTVPFLLDSMRKLVEFLKTGTVLSKSSFTTFLPRGNNVFVPKAPLLFLLKAGIVKP